MATYNTVIKKRNTLNNGWDSILPITTADNVLLNEQGDTVATELPKKVDKIEGKGLSTEDYTSAEKSKLAGVEAGANNYTHPTSHPASMITGLPTKLSELQNDIGAGSEMYDAVRDATYKLGVTDGQLYIEEVG